MITGAGRARIGEDTVELTFTVPADACEPESRDLDISRPMTGRPCPDKKLDGEGRQLAEGAP